MKKENIFDKLRALQEILSKKCEVEAEIEEIPKVIAIKTELLSRLKKSNIEKNNNIENLKNRIKELRNKMYEAESEREKYEKQMDIIKTQREYEALDKQIKDATAREQELRKEIQRMEGQQEELKNNIKKEEQLIQKQESEVKSEQTRIKSELKEKNKVLKTLQKEEAEITPGMDDDILFKFERIIRNKSGLGIVPIKNGVCTGCYMLLTPQFVNKVRIEENIEFCPECSRILYYDEGIDEEYEYELDENDDNE